MELVPIKEHLYQNQAFAAIDACREGLAMTIDFYKRIGFNPPWIGYFVKMDDEVVGMAAFKGKPVKHRVEIAYGTLPEFQNRGIGANIARKLIEVALETEPDVLITARTLPEENFSTRILRKNDFVLQGTVHDPEDGEVWEWLYVTPS